MEKLIGYCSVDSGQILLCDPCYIDSQWQRNTDPDFTKKGTKKHKGEFSYRGCCIATSGAKFGGQLNHGLGHPGAGVAICSGLGDGHYPVYATIKTLKNAGKRVESITIKFL